MVKKCTIYSYISAAVLHNLPFKRTNAHTVYAMHAIITTFAIFGR